MQNIAKQVREFFLLALENKEKHIKGESDLSELTKAIDLISGNFDDCERERPATPPPHKCFYCNYAGNSFFYSHVGDGFKL